MFNLLLTQTLQLAFRKGGGTLGTVAFYVIIVTLFTLALGPEFMANHAGAVMAASMLLSSLIAMPLMFERDYEDGTLEQLLLAPAPLEIITLAKITGQWLAIAVPILLASPLVAVLAGLSFNHMSKAFLLLCLASPSMVAVSAIGAAITLGVKRGGLLQALIVLPLYIPILIFAATGGQGAILFLSAILCASIPLSCYVTAALIRASLD
jgi:heme exporter protein B